MSILRLIRLALLFVSLFGYLQHFSKKLKPELALGFILTSIGSIMFFAGLAGFAPFNLPCAAWAIFAVGLVLAAMAFKDIKGSVLRVATPGIVFFVVMCGVLFIVLHGSLLVHYDNFSHWALAPEVLINFDRFPTGEDLQITFQSYPLGSAAFVYFVAEIYGGNSEWLMMFGQAIMLCGLAGSVFAFAKCTKGKVIAAAGALMLLCTNTEFVDLLVDSLLPLIAVSAMALCICYRDQLDKKLWYTVPFMVFLMAVKNSGALFVVFIALYVLLFIPKNRKSIISWAVTALCPAVTLLAWQSHVKSTFVSGMTSRHSMSLEYFKQVFAMKDFNVIAQTLLNMCKETFSFSNSVVWLFVFVTAVLLMQKAGVTKDARLLKHTSLLAVVCYFIYQLGTFAMYIFAMPDRDATTTLTSYVRYHRTIVIFVVALVLFGLLQSEISLEKFVKNQKLAAAAMTVCCVAGLYISTQPYLSMYIPQRFKAPTERHIVQNIAAEYGINKGSSYMMLVEENDKSGYYFFMGRYAFGSLNVEERTPSKLLEDDSILKNYQYLVVVDKSAETKQYLAQRYGDENLKAVHLPDYYHIIGT